jgi:hypothetical protein
MVGQVVNLPKQDHGDIKGTLLLDFRSCNDTINEIITIKCFKRCITRSKTNTRVNSLTASSCGMIKPTTMRPRVEDQPNAIYSRTLLRSLSRDQRIGDFLRGKLIRSNRILGL